MPTATIVLFTMMLLTSGCVASWARSDTPDEVRAAGYTLSHTSQVPPEQVAQCLVRTLNTHSEGFVHPFSVARAEGTTVLKQAEHGLVQQVNSLRESGEVVYVIDNVAKSEGTVTTISVSKYLMFSQAFLEKLDRVVQTCL